MVYHDISYMRHATIRTIVVFMSRYWNDACGINWMSCAPLQEDSTTY